MSCACRHTHARTHTPSRQLPRPVPALPVPFCSEPEPRLAGHLTPQSSPLPVPRHCASCFVHYHVPLFRFVFVICAVRSSRSGLYCSMSQLHCSCPMPLGPVHESARRDGRGTKCRIHCCFFTSGPILYSRGSRGTGQPSSCIMLLLIMINIRISHEDGRIARLSIVVGAGGVML